MRPAARYYPKYNCHPPIFDVSKNGVILEFKAPKDATEANLIKEAAVALQQIKEKKYAMELEMKGVKNIISIGIAFAKKDVRICFEKSWIKLMADS